MLLIRERKKELEWSEVVWITKKKKIKKEDEEDVLYGSEISETQSEIDWL